MLVLRMAAVLTGSGSAASHPVDNEIWALSDIHGDDGCLLNCNLQPTCARLFLPYYRLCTTLIAFLLQTMNRQTYDLLVVSSPGI